VGGNSGRAGVERRRGFPQVRHRGAEGSITLHGIASDGTGRVFIATRKGVVVTSHPEPGKDAQVSFLPWPPAVPQHRASNVYVASPGEVWFGCDTAICRWNGRDIRVWDRDTGVPPHKWDFFLMDKSGNLWARNRDALIELASGANRFQEIDPHLPGQISIPPELAMDSKGRILVTTDRGLAIGGPGGWRRVTQKQGLPTTFVSAVLQDAEGSMWVGTYGAGLARWAGYDTWQSFTELEGLASSSIWSLLDDPPSGMWVGTAVGLSHGVFSKGTWNWSEVSIPGVGVEPP
jgi:ligand-binding sensor domain-containing protein